MCCFDSGDGTRTSAARMSAGRYCCGACRLEPVGRRRHDARTAAVAARDRPDPARSRQPDDRAVPGRRASTVERIRVFSEDCELDAGGRPVAGWRACARPTAWRCSSRSRCCRAGRGDNVMDGAVTAIALTAIQRRRGARSAGRGRAARSGAPEGDVLARQRARRARARHAAAGAARRPEREVQEERPSSASRRAARRPRSTCSSGLARTDAEPRVRSEAVFWLAQKGDPRAAARHPPGARQGPVARGAQEGGLRAQSAQGRRRRRGAHQRSPRPAPIRGARARRSSGSGRRPARRRPRRSPIASTTTRTPRSRSARSSPSARCRRPRACRC